MPAPNRFMDNVMDIEKTTLFCYNLLGFCTPADPILCLMWNLGSFGRELMLTEKSPKLILSCATSAGGRMTHCFFLSQQVKLKRGDVFIAVS